MKIILDISEETLAGIWANTWEDRETDGMKARLAGVLSAKGMEYFQAFPHQARARVIEEYRKSPHYLQDEQPAIASILAKVPTSHLSLRSSLSDEDCERLRGTYPRNPRDPNFEVVKSAPEYVLIRDLGPWDKHRSITNGAEEAVKAVHAIYNLCGKRLGYYDSEGELGELLHDGAGKFTGYGPMFKIE